MCPESDTGTRPIHNHMNNPDVHFAPHRLFTPIRPDMKKANTTAMNILFIHHEPEVQDEIKDFLTPQREKGFFARSTEQAIRILNEYVISLVVMKISSLRDAAILKYINDNYKDLEVLILASKEYDDIISAFSRGHFRLMRQPVALNDLKKNIEEIIEVGAPPEPDIHPPGDEVSPFKI